MKCPYCNEEMEQGVIQSQQEINWQEKTHMINRSDLYDGAVRLSKRSFVKGSAVEAWLCRKCEKVIIDYSDEKSDFNNRRLNDMRK